MDTAFRARDDRVEAAIAHWAPRFACLTLKNVASSITWPFYIVAGKLDRIVPWQDREKLARAARGPVEFVLIEDGRHVSNNRGYRYRPQSPTGWRASSARRRHSRLHDERCDRINPPAQQEETS